MARKNSDMTTEIETEKSGFHPCNPNNNTCGASAATPPAVADNYDHRCGGYATERK